MDHETTTQQGLSHGPAGRLYHNTHLFRWSAGGVHNPINHLMQALVTVCKASLSTYLAFHVHHADLVLFRTLVHAYKKFQWLHIVTPYDFSISNGPPRC